MTSARAMIALIVAAWLVAGMPSARAQNPVNPAGAHPVDPKLVGIWEAAVPSPQGGVIHMRSYTNADGTFLTIFPGTAIPPIGGTISATNGVYVTLTLTGSDGGAYTFTSPDQVTMAGKYGPPVTWHRATN